MVDPVANGLTDGDLRPWDRREVSPQLLEHHVVIEGIDIEARVDLRRIDSLSVLVELGSARAAGSFEHRRVAQQDLLESTAQCV